MVAGVGVTAQRTALVFGGSGQIGVPLLARLLVEGWQVYAVSRSVQPSSPGLVWLRGDFGCVENLPTHIDAVFSAGPLDLFSRWYAQSPVETPRVIAFGSTSADIKQDSVDAGERDIAARLVEAEQLIVGAATARSSAVTLLRPTLVYGAGRDLTLSRIAAIARRTGFFVLPGGAKGLRQPVHVEDLADAAVAVLDRTLTHDRVYALPGGETLEYREMVRRMLASLQPPVRLMEVPAPMFRVAVSLAQGFGRLRGFNAATLARMREDLVFDMAAAHQDFGYTPRAFRPEARMFQPPGQ